MTQRVMRVSRSADSIAPMPFELFVMQIGITSRDYRWDYGEELCRLLRELEGRVFVVIFTVRNSTIRIISACKANKREVREYDKNARQD